MWTGRVTRQLRGVKAIKRLKVRIPRTPGLPQVSLLACGSFILRRHPESHDFGNQQGQGQLFNDRSFASLCISINLLCRGGFQTRPRSQYSTPEGQTVAAKTPRPAPQPLPVARARYRRWTTWPWSPRVLKLPSGRIPMEPQPPRPARVSHGTTPHRSAQPRYRSDR